MNKKTLPILFSGALLFLASCQQSQTKVEQSQAAPVVEEVVVTEHVWVVDEHHINEIPVTNHPAAKPRVKKESPKVINRIEAEPAGQLDYSVKAAEELHLAVKESEELVPVPVTEVTELAIPLDETQTVTAYTEKGKFEGAALVVSNGNGEIDHIIFDNKHHHKDYYNVHAGMSAREVRKLRREMKHMAHKGQVFFYADGSNIMYVLDTKFADGTEVTDEMVDQSFVSAIVWKDKNHKDHPQNL